MEIRGMRAVICRRTTCISPSPQSALSQQSLSMSPRASSSGDELVGKDESPFGMLPAGKSFDASDSPCSNADLRLIVEHELAAFKGEQQFLVGNSNHWPRGKGLRRLHPLRVCFQNKLQFGYREGFLQVPDDG